MGTPHNHAEIGDIAEKVLLPGDPMRAKFIAEIFWKMQYAITKSEVCMDLPVFIKAKKCQFREREWECRLCIFMPVN